MQHPPISHHTHHRLAGHFPDLLTWLLDWREDRGVKGGAWTRAATITVLLGGTTLVVYLTGGTSFVYVHLAYLPVLIGAFFFGVVGGVVTGIIAGLCFGPLMPLDVAHGLAQSPINWMSRAGFFALSGGLAGLICSAFTRQIEMVRRHGHFDAVTGLPNRSRLLEDVEALVTRGQENASPLALLTLGLTHFDTVLTTLGHRHADKLRELVAARLRSLLAPDEQTYDLGSGMFTVPLPSGDDTRALELSDSFRRALQDPILIENVPVLSGGLCGIGRYPDHGSDARAVLRASVAALREAERLGLPYAIYDERNDQARRRVASLLPDLHQALRTGDQLALHYQPKLKLDTGLCIGVEALIRWTHPERGPIPPGQFIGLAEKTALIGPLTEWVLAAALRQLAVWKRDGIGLSIAINASVRNLEDPAFPVIVADRLAHYGVDPSRLEIEITESALMSAPDRVRLALNELRGLGVSVALDDFGTGHSSLTYLRDLPANTLKLDRSYLRNLRTDHKSRLIVRSTIETAHELGFRVVAEGIEDRESYERLGDLACDIGQGFYICRPLPAAELCGWLRSRMVPAEGVAPAGLTATGQG